MANLNLKSPKLLFLITFFLILFVFLSSIKFGSSQGNANKQQINFRIESQTPSLSIVESAIEDGAVRLSLKNGYTSTLTAFSVSSNGIITRQDLGEDDALLPDAVITRFYEIPESPQKGITIIAAVYEDGTFEGRPKYVNQILDARAGRQAQLERLTPIIQDTLLNTKNKNLYQGIRNLKTRIERLPEQEAGRSFEYNSALRGTKELALIRMKRYEEQQEKEGEGSTLNALMHYKSWCERKSIMLKNALKQQ